MHRQILSKEQESLLSLLKIFSKDFVLVGDTAIALHIGHRESIDFDLFSNKGFDNLDISKKIKENFKIDSIIFDRLDEFTALVNGVKVTFLYYPYKINGLEHFDDVIQIPDILSLAAMKAFALGRRAKWKDYVDLYFISKKFNGLDRVVDKSKQIFGSEFNEKQFRVQLSYFDDIDFSEKVQYLKGFEVNDSVIQEDLRRFSLV